MQSIVFRLVLNELRDYNCLEKDRAILAASTFEAARRVIRWRASLFTVRF